MNSFTVNKIMIDQPDKFGKFANFIFSHYRIHRSFPKIVIIPGFGCYTLDEWLIGEVAVYQRELSTLTIV